ncbi:ABC transporter ATP-binding protein [Kribbella sp. HUAS MG21]|uniref:ABC transporter ATP-binding protein n=1 Tax=Kribbella sp. HUAS MG21 TaxID=3160966 RepID=A0AAU7T615_9ACTN
MTGIKLDSVSKVFSGRYVAVDNVSLEIAAGEVMVLLGPSGCGKTTLLRIIAGLEDLSTGDVWLGRTHATDLPPKERGVALVFQNGALYPNRTGRENIMFPLRMAGDDATEAGEKADGVAKILRIDTAVDRLPRTLSGGQRQRVAIGRALVRQPRIFLMDEPLSNLDATLRTELRQEIGAMVRDLSVTTVYVTHDQIEALTLADRIAIMRDGRIEDVGTPAQVYNDPATAFGAGFLGTPRINLMAATVRVTAHHRVSLDFGTQSLSLPPLDRRSLILSQHDGIRVIVGARSEAFTLTSEHGENQLTGKLRALEFHGNQWMAFVATGIDMVDPDAVGQAPPRHRADRSHTRHAVQRAPLRTRLATAAKAALHRSEAPRTADTQASATHRRSDLVIEVDSGNGLRTGDAVQLTVDTSRLHLFDEHGHRVDRVTR